MKAEVRPGISEIQRRRIEVRDVVGHEDARPVAGDALEALDAEAHPRPLRQLLESMKRVPL